MTLRVLVVDDEPPARTRLRQLLEEIPDAECVGEAATGEEAVALAESAAPDVVLLDIRMPGMGGLEAARRMAALPEPPAVIFTTAYELAAALERARRTQLSVTREAEGSARRAHIAARVRDQIRLIPVTEVLCFVAEQKYTTVRHLGGEDLIEDSLRSLEEEFGTQFVRIHRNALVAIAQVEALERDPDGHAWVRLRHGGGRLQVSRRLAADVQRRLR